VAPAAADTTDYAAERGASWEGGVSARYGVSPTFALMVERVPAAESQYVALPQVNTSDFIGSIAAFTGVQIADCIRAAYVDALFWAEQARSLLAK